MHKYFLLRGAASHRAGLGLAVRWLAVVALSATAVACGEATTTAGDAAGAGADAGFDGSGLDGLFVDSPVWDADVPAVLDQLASELPNIDSQISDGKPADGALDAGVCSTAGCLCVSNGECDSGYCIESPGGQVCAQKCVTTCPADFTCKTISLSGGDTDSLCVPSHPRICEPCKTDSDCSGAMGASASTCVPYLAANGANIGGFCGATCDAANPCPTGYGCESVTSVGGAKSMQCRKTDLQCACDGRAIQLGLATVCSSANAAGKCGGERSCSVAGLGACSAPSAVSETCNNLDDDCDGKTDEPDPGVCNDGSDCTYDNCVGGVCQHPAATGGCDDADACTSGDACNGGVCAGKSIACDDGNPCTDDTCAPGKGCVAAYNTAPCDDNDACTSGDTCKGGTCMSAVPSLCDDGNPCTTETCDSKGGCKSTNNTLACSDDSVCTAGDQCAGGKCAPGKALACNDGNPCTDDTCLASSGCVFANNTASCSDFNVCTEGDQCADGSCTSGPLKGCDDGNPCTIDGCAAKEGCTHTASDAPCSDNNVCTVGDTCSAGKCASGLTKNCDDGNPCSTDVCDATKGCLAISNAEPCTDNNVCTVGDTCTGSKCLSGKVKSCGDGNPCTDDSCDASTDCVNTPNAAACSDGDVCTLGDACTSGKCAAGLKTVCDDGNPCTDDGCDAQKGCTTKANTAPCSDANLCTVADSCAQGVCVPGKAQDCNDGEPCTSDGCNPALGCTLANNTLPCDDGNTCTLGDVCAGGACKPGALASCDDGNPCTDDSCDKIAGCKHGASSQACDDNNACTSGDKCGAGKCVSGVAVNCDDNNGCTDDTCSAALGCKSLNNIASCSDGNVCTGGDICAAGACKPGATISCSDGNACTNDTCDPIKGCQFSNNISDCDDKNLCTVGDKCGSGVCTSGAVQVCDDKNPCTDDSCDAQKGCVASNNIAPCSDNNVCTTGDACKTGTCAAGAGVVCDDKNPCTIDSCDASKGCITSTVADGTACGSGQQCSAGTCVAACAGTWLTSNTAWTQNNATYASEILGGYAATNLFDNDWTTRWVTSSTTNQWVIFNLGAPATLSSIRIVNQANYTANSGGKDTVLQVSNSLSGPWTDVTSFTVANQQSSFQAFNFSATKSQYWRVFVKNNWGYPSYIQFMEVGLFGCL